MLLRILKSNPLVSLVLPVLLAVTVWVSVYAAHGSEQLKTGIPMFETVFSWLIKMPLVSVIVAFALLVLEAFMWNTFVNAHGLLKQSSYFTATLFLLLYSCRPILVSFYPSLVAAMFLILALKRLAESYKKEKALSEAFDAGIFIGIASLLYFPFAVFIVFLWIGLLTMRSLVWREWVLSLIGFMLPFGFALGYYSVFYSPEHFWYEKLLAPLTNYHKPPFPGWEAIFLITTLIVTFIITIFFYLKKFSDNVVKNQKISALIVWFACFSGASVLLSPERDGRAFSLLAMPLSFIYANYFVRTKSRFIPELLFIALLGAIVINIFF
jgi:hypothetical protein